MRPGESSPAGPVPPPRVILVLGAAVLAISSAAVLVRMLEGAQPIAIAIWRMAGSAILLAPSIRRVSRRDGLWIAVSGVFLAGHFAAWFSSLQLTTVLRSTVLVCSSPVWVGVLAWLLLGERPTRRYWLGLTVALAGVALMGSGQSGTGDLRGDLLAALGGLFAAFYFLIGRAVRRRVSIGTYASLVCAAAALALLPVGLLSSTPLWGFSLHDALLIAALTLGPQLIGHNGFNYALAYVPATVVSAVTLLEPVGASLLALLLLGEQPSLSEALGGLSILGGVSLALRPARHSPNTPAA